jgi:hypothetical protein
MKRSIEKLFCDVQTGELVDTTTGDASRRENYPIKWEMQMCALNNLLSYRRYCCDPYRQRSHLSNVTELEIDAVIFV